MLAVLPFENLTGDAGQDYFSDGLTEEMIAQLGRLNPEHLGVIARTSVMQYKNSPEQLPKIGADLGVQYVLEGSVRRDSGNVRITAQLIQVKDQTPVWSRQYDRELSGLLALQGEVAQEIADEIQVTLGANPKRSTADHRPAAAAATSYEAYDLYLRGRYFWNKRTKEGFEQAADYFQQAIDKAPNYARAYAGLADTYGLMSTWSMGPPDEYMPKARAAALRAAQLDDSLAEAHTSLALIAQNYDHDWHTAENELRRAIQLDPSYATAHQWYAECLSLQGRFEEALAESERARQLDPLSVIIAADHGAILYFSRQYDRAIEQFHAVLTMAPTFGRAHMICYAYVEKGMFREALTYAERWRHSEGTPVWDKRTSTRGPASKSGPKARWRNGSGGTRSTGQSSRQSFRWPTSPWGGRKKRWHCWKRATPSIPTRWSKSRSDRALTHCEAIRAFRTCCAASA
jgi:TolB-like protein